MLSRSCVVNVEVSLERVTGADGECVDGSCVVGANSRDKVGRVANNVMDAVTCEPMDHISSQTGRDIRETGRKERAEKGIESPHFQSRSGMLNRIGEFILTGGII